MEKVNFPKVILFSNELPPKIGGVADYTLMLKENLEKLGLKVSLSGNLSKVKVAPEIFHLQYQGYLYPFSFGLSFLPLWLKIKLRGGKFLVTFHDFSTPSFLHKANLLILLFLTEKIITPALTPKVLKLKNLPFLGKKLNLIPLASNILKLKISEKEKSALKDEYGLLKFVFAYFGLIRKDKGIETLFSAFENLKREDTCLLLIGERPKEKLPKNIVATGFLEKDKVSKLLQISDVAVFPFTDGVSLRRGSFLAALLHNLSIITTRGDYLPSSLKDRENVYLIPPNDKKTLILAMQELMDDRALRQRLSLGTKKISGLYSWENIAQKHLEVYLRQGLPL